MPYQSSSLPPKKHVHYTPSTAGPAPSTYARGSHHHSSSRDSGVGLSGSSERNSYESSTSRGYDSGPIMSSDYQVLKENYKNAKEALAQTKGLNSRLEIQLQASEAMVARLDSKLRISDEDKNAAKDRASEYKARSEHNESKLQRSEDGRLRAEDEANKYKAKVEQLEKDNARLRSKNSEPKSSMKRPSDQRHRDDDARRQRDRDDEAKRLREEQRRLDEEDERRRSLPRRPRHPSIVEPNPFAPINPPRSQPLYQTPYAPVVSPQTRAYQQVPLDPGYAVQYSIGEARQGNPPADGLYHSKPL